MPKHYLYRHIRTDLNIPFYIGIGTKKFRYKNPTLAGEYERAFDAYDRSMFWKRVVNKCNNKIEVEIVYESDSYSEIISKEKEFIALYGRANQGYGCLVNLTDGGEGTLNYTPTPGHKAKISAGLRALNLKRSDETKAKISQSNTGKKRSPEVCDKHRALRKCYKHTKEAKQKISATHKGRKSSEETKKRISLSLKGKRLGTKQPPEVIEKKRKSMLGRKLSDQTKQKISTSHKGKKHTVETKIKLVLAWKKRAPMSDETRHKLSIAMKKVRNSKSQMT